MTSSIYGIGTGALSNAQAGVLTAGHNIANANTPGFSRQTVEQKTNEAFFTGAGFIGTGASVSTIRRIYDGFLVDQVRQSNSDATSLSTYLGQMKQIDNLLGDPSAGLSPALSGFFQSVQAVSAQPADMSARQALVSSAQALSARFRSFDAQLNSLREAANRNIQTSVGRINSMTQQIAIFNDRISRLAGTGTASQQPNDLLDQRDALVVDLNKEIGASVVQASDGSYSVFLSSGQPIVLGNNAYALKAVADAEDASDTQVSVAMGTGQLRLRADDLSGGKLGGYLSFRREGLTDAQNALGRIAITVAASVNDQHRLGQDLNGNPGKDVFTIGNPAVIANANNTGTAVVSASVADYSALEASDYRIAYDGTNYTVTRLSDNTVGLPGSLPQTVDGVLISITGSPTAGDRFLIQPVRAGARDLDVALTNLRSIAAAAPIRTAAGLNNTGTGAVDAGEVDMPSPPTAGLNANLQNPVTITFTSPTTFDVSGAGTGDPSGVAFSPGAGISYNGWTIRLNGQPAAGDTFTVGPNTNGSGDNRNAQLLAGLQIANLVGGTTFNGAYGQLVSQVGNKAGELQITSDAQASLASEAEKSQSTVSGVNLDEEASNLIRYQQAYQAAGKMISIANTLFDTILNLRQ
jgi:flagellar hook-associated protein 1 FlgK